MGNPSTPAPCEALQSRIEPLYCFRPRNSWPKLILSSRIAEADSCETPGILAALLIDGVHFGKHVVLAAVGVDKRGHKHVLGLREGATENAAAVKALLADLVERGLDTGRALLVVIDGAKARCTRRWPRSSAAAS
jgi:Transposase, Mutator family